MTDEIRDIINAYGREMMYVETMHEDVFDRRGQASIDYLRSKGFSSCFLHEGEKHHFYVERAGVRTYWQETAQMSTLPGPNGLHSYLHHDKYNQPEGTLDLLCFPEEVRGSGDAVTLLYDIASGRTVVEHLSNSKVIKKKE